MIKLFSVIEWLTKGRDKLSVPMQVPTHKKVGVAFAKTNLGVCDVVHSVLHTLHDNGEFATRGTMVTPHRVQSRGNSCCMHSSSTPAPTMPRTLWKVPSRRTIRVKSFPSISKNRHHVPHWTGMMHPSDSM